MAGGGVGGPCGRRGGLVRVRHGYQAPGSEINLLIHNGQVSKVSLIVTFTLILKKKEFFSTCTDVQFKGGGS